MTLLLRATLGLLLCLAAAGTARAQLIRQHSNTGAEFRAIHAASPTVVWAAGRGGTVAVTTDGGATWRADTVAGAGDLVITGMWARDARAAYVVVTSFGDQGFARIYRTNDGGRTWTQQWERAGDGVFFDALRCWSVERCLAFGDAIDGVFPIVRTENGRTWHAVPEEKVPLALSGEGGFAASGTTLTILGTRRAWIGTGVGRVARVYATSDGGASWRVAETPLPGNATTGIFGIAFRDSLTGVAVGGDYEKRTERQQNVLRTNDGGRTWEIIGAARPHGVRYGVAYAHGGAARGALLAVGPSGAGISVDDGETWNTYDPEPWNTVAFAPNGDAWIAGTDGRIAKIPSAVFEGARAARELRRDTASAARPRN